MAQKTQYLRRINQSWYVRVKVPASVRGRFNSTHVQKALHTRDLDQADRLKWAHVAEIKRQFDRLQQQDPHLRSAEEFRYIAAKIKGGPDEDFQRELHEERAQEVAEQIELTTGDTEKARQWYSLATSQEATLDDLVETWLSSSDYPDQTKNQHRHAYKELRTYLGLNLLPSQITEGKAGDFVEEYLKKSGDAYRTQRRKLGSLSVFWSWLAERKHVSRSANPWKGFKLSRRRTEKQTPKKRPYSTEELLTLFSTRPKYAGLADVMVLGLYTGMRLEEICSLKDHQVTPCEGGFLVTVEAGKTEAAERSVAVAHGLPRAILERRKGAGGQLFPEFKAGSYGKHSWNVTKAFADFRTKLGLSRETDFHSFRRTLITLLENAPGIDQVMIARYVGHSLPTIAFKVYSGGATAATQMTVAKAIQYPATVEAALASFCTGPCARS